MYLIVGLGNPGEQYEKSPHNSGFLLVEKLRLSLKDEGELSVGEWSEDKLFQSHFCKVEENGELIAVLQKPQTFMNRSGFAVKGAIKRFGLNDFTNQLILVHDDLDLKLGSYKIQKEKAPKAHNGVMDIENALGEKGFLRVRVGVDGRIDRKISGDKYVLIPYTDKEYEILENSVLSAIGELREIIQF